MFRSSEHDPLAAAIAPPSNETPAARTARLSAEAEARRVSDEIDEALRAERTARRRQRPCVKVPAPRPERERFVMPSFPDACPRINA
jgi:hypothetical protein